MSKPPYKILILVGPPCSGKSTWAKKESLKYDVLIISRDDIRDILFGRGYKQNREDENRVTEFSDAWIERALNEENSIILDNTHCKSEYIESVTGKFYKAVRGNIRIKYFNCPLWLLLVRNVWRTIRTGKKIPVNVILNMKKNFKKVKKYYGKSVAYK